MTHSDQLNEFAAALATAQATITVAKKASDNAFFKSKYADLASIADACRAPLSANGIAVVQAPSTLDDGRVCLTTTLLHKSGQWVSASVSALPKDNGPQALGSILTYLRRYALAAMTGVAPDDDVDDDGERAEARTPAPRPAKKAPAPLPAADVSAFDAWLLDLEATADLGTAALEQAWKASLPAFRKRLKDTDTPAWESLKAKAATVVPS